jgi:hypothetical protein
MGKGAILGGVGVRSKIKKSWVEPSAFCCCMLERQTCRCTRAHLKRTTSNAGLNCARWIRAPESDASRRAGAGAAADPQLRGPRPRRLGRAFLCLPLGSLSVSQWEVVYYHIFRSWIKSWEGGVCGAGECPGTGRGLRGARMCGELTTAPCMHVRARAWVPHHHGVRCTQPLHGPHMYSFPFRNASPTKFGVGIGAYVFLGMYLPWFAFGFSQRKAGTPGW